MWSIIAGLSVVLAQATLPGRGSKGQEWCFDRWQGAQLCEATEAECNRLRGINQTAAQRGRGLLILAGKVVFADRSADAVKGFERLALAVQRLAQPAREAPRAQDRVDLVHLVGLGDRREPHDFPFLLAERPHLREVLTPVVKIGRVSL